MKRHGKWDLRHIHYVGRLYEADKKPVHGHFPEVEESEAQKH